MVPGVTTVNSAPSVAIACWRAKEERTRSS
jgi:hypothetical protein